MEICNVSSTEKYKNHACLWNVIRWGIFLVTHFHKQINQKNEFFFRIAVRRDRERKTYEKQFFFLWLTIDVGLVSFLEIKRVHATNLFVTEMERSFACGCRVAAR